MKKRLLVLVIYCIPCLVSLLLLIEYKGRTNYVAEEIKHIASYIKEPERLIISEETLNQLKIKNFPNDVLEKLAEKKSGKATGKETFFNDIRGMILNDSGKELIGMDYSNFDGIFTILYYYWRGEIPENQSVLPNRQRIYPHSKRS